MNYQQAAALDQYAMIANQYSWQALQVQQQGLGHLMIVRDICLCLLSVVIVTFIVMAALQARGGNP